jgi:hypothetical protein
MRWQSLRSDAQSLLVDLQQVAGSDQQDGHLRIASQMALPSLMLAAAGGRSRALGRPWPSITTILLSISRARSIA